MTRKSSHHLPEPDTLHSALANVVIAADTMEKELQKFLKLNITPPPPWWHRFNKKKITTNQN